MSGQKNFRHDSFSVGQIESDYLWDSPKGWDLLSPMNANDRFFFSHTSAKMVVSLEPTLFKGMEAAAAQRQNTEKPSSFGTTLFLLI